MKEARKFSFIQNKSIATNSNINNSYLIIHAFVISKNKALAKRVTPAGVVIICWN